MSIIPRARLLCVFAPCRPPCPSTPIISDLASVARALASSWILHSDLSSAFTGPSSASELVAIVAHPCETMDLAKSIPDLVERAWKIKEAFEEYRENQTTLYRLSAELLDDVEELEGLRRGYVSNNLPALDHNLSLLKSGFENVLDRYEKLLNQQQRKNLLYKGLAF
ncbi:hypothetical protein DFH11DRAFT_1744063 [Phellopilus nigrolimitatus]|nr:hypothetical protein DFH11DRAFT_1744063 [Phellopilus nigrolimitatus]